MNELFNYFFNQSYKIIKYVHHVNFWWDRLILWGYPNSSKFKLIVNIFILCWVQYMLYF